MVEYERNDLPYRTNPRRPMGLNSITYFTDELCLCAGINKSKHSKHYNQGGCSLTISKMVPKGVSAVKNMGMDRHINVSIHDVDQDPNGEDHQSRLQAFHVKQQMLASFGSNNGVNTGHTIMAQQQIKLQQQTVSQPADQHI
jgi:hypothetical protein